MKHQSLVEEIYNRVYEFAVQSKAEIVDVKTDSGPWIDCILVMQSFSIDLLIGGVAFKFDCVAAKNQATFSINSALYNQSYLIDSSSTAMGDIKEYFKEYSMRSLKLLQSATQSFVIIDSMINETTFGRVVGNPHPSEFRTARKYENCVFGMFIYGEPLHVASFLANSKHAYIYGDDTSKDEMSDLEYLRRFNSLSLEERLEYAKRKPAEVLRMEIGYHHAPMAVGQIVTDDQVVANSFGPLIRECQAWTKEKPIRYEIKCLASYDLTE